MSLAAPHSVYVVTAAAPLPPPRTTLRRRGPRPGPPAPRAPLHRVSSSDQARWQTLADGDNCASHYITLHNITLDIRQSIIYCQVPWSLSSLLSAISISSRSWCGCAASLCPAEHYTVYTDTEQVQTAESRLSPAPPQFDHPHHPPPCPVLIFNLSINTVPV